MTPERLGYRHVELDALWWEPDSTEAGSGRFSERAAEAASGECWVIDGNYFSVGARTWRAAERVRTVRVVNSVHPEA